MGLGDQEPAEDCDREVRVLWGGEFGGGVDGPGAERGCRCAFDSGVKTVLFFFHRNRARGCAPPSLDNIKLPTSSMYCALRLLLIVIIVIVVLIIIVITGALQGGSLVDVVPEVPLVLRILPSGEPPEGVDAVWRVEASNNERLVRCC